MPLIGSEIDEDKFLKMTDETIANYEETKEILRESLDVYTYYWIMGKISGLKQSKEIIKECIEKE